MHSKLPPGLILIEGLISRFKSILIIESNRHDLIQSGFDRVRLNRLPPSSGLVHANRVNYTVGFTKLNRTPPQILCCTFERTCEKIMKTLVWILVVALVILHHDFWNWNNDYLVFGFMPIGLFYQVCISIAASLVWFFATLVAWPKEVDFEQERRDMETLKKLEERA